MSAKTADGSREERRINFKKHLSLSKTSEPTQSSAGLNIDAIEMD